MSATGQKQTSRHVRVMSVIPLKADIHQCGLYIRLVPTRDINGGVKTAPSAAPLPSVALQPKPSKED